MRCLSPYEPSARRRGAFRPVGHTCVDAERNGLPGSHARPMRRRTIRPMPARRIVLIAAVAAASSVAVACSRDAGANDQPNASQVLNSALEAHAAGNLDEAIRLYERVLVLDPQNQYAYYNLGLIDQTRGKDEEAVEEYEHALASDPSFEPALFNLAIIRAQQGNNEAAISLYRQVIDVDPSAAGAHLNLGFLLLRAGERREGRAELAQAVQLDPELESRIPDRDVVVSGTTGP